MRLIDRMVNTQRLCHHLFSQFLELAFAHQINLFWFAREFAAHIFSVFFFLLKNHLRIHWINNSFFCLFFCLKKRSLGFFPCVPSLIFRFVFRWMTEEVRNSFQLIACKIIFHTAYDSKSLGIQNLNQSNIKHWIDKSLFGFFLLHLFMCQHFVYARICQR